MQTRRGSVVQRCVYAELECLGERRRLGGEECAKKGGHLPGESLDEREEGRGGDAGDVDEKLAAIAVEEEGVAERHGGPGGGLHAQREGAEGVLVTTAEEHDIMIAYTSQLAHVVSSAYVRAESAEKHYGYSAGSFRDMTRVARMNSAMWTELMGENADNLSREVRALAARLLEYADALDSGDSAALYELLDAGNRTKLSVEKDRIKKTRSVFDGE